MKRLKLWLTAGLLALLSGCSDVPSERAGRTVYENMSFVGYQEKDVKAGLIKLTTFKKTNGTMREIFGQKVYTLEYEATLLFPNGKNMRCHNQRPGWTCRGDNTDVLLPGGSEVNKGQLQFEKTEKGWKGRDGKLY